MIVHDVTQGSREWFDLRLGIPTVSRFSSFITPAKLAYGAGAKTLVSELVAERILGRPCDWGVEESTAWTERGQELEAEAVRFYEMHKGCDTKPVGFITTDGGKAGGSPDSLVLGPDGEPMGGLEIKCRGARNHMKTVLGHDPIGDPLQVQGYLWITGLPWWDQLAYNPDLPCRINRVYPDGETFRAIETNLDKLYADIETAEKLLEAASGVIEWDERDGHDDLVDKLYESVGGVT